MAKLAKNDFITILAEELASTVTADVRMTKKLAGEILEGVENAYERAITVEQINVGLGGLGQFKVDVKPERNFRNPQTGDTVVKPEHLAVKFAVSKGFKETLAQTAIN